MLTEFIGSAPPVPTFDMRQEWHKQPLWDWQGAYAKSYADHLLDKYHGRSVSLELVQHALASPDQVLGGSKTRRPGQLPLTIVGFLRRRSTVKVVTALLLGTCAHGRRRLEPFLVQPDRSGHAGADPDLRRLDAVLYAPGLVAQSVGLLRSALLGLAGGRQGLPGVARRGQGRPRRQLLMELSMAGRFARSRCGRCTSPAWLCSPY